MANGIEISNGTTRTLSLDGVTVAEGGNLNRAGLYVIGNKLYLDGAVIAESNNSVGFIRKADGLYFGDVQVGSDIPEPPTPPSAGLWLPPTQEASTLNKYTYPSLLAAYDALMSESSYNGTIKKYQYTESNLVETTIKDSKYGNNHTHKAYSHAFTEVAAGSYDDSGTSVADISYPLYHYEFAPTNYTKTFYVQAGIHGNEKDAPQTILRFFDIICNHCNEAAYSRLRPLRDNVRFIVVPVVSPVGYSASPNGTMNVPWIDWDGTSKSGSDAMNMNRNFDFNQEYTLDGAGKGGNYPFQRSEVRHVKAVIERIGKHNIDYLFDNHDGGDVNKHFWFNYNMDGANAPVMRQVLADLIDYEEELREAGGTDYRDFNNASADAKGYVHPNVADQGGYSTGTTSAWAGITEGILASGPEYIGGYFGYTFNAEQMTRSLRIRANVILYAYELINTKGWTVNEDGDYFHFDYPMSMTRQTLRQDETKTEYDNRVVTIGQVYDRWDKLAAANSSYITKSAKLGENSSGDSIYSYTLGNGNKKVLLLGGSMRWGIADKYTEFGMYVLAEYLCNANIVAQSSFLQTLKQDYTIVVLPCIDINAGGNSEGKKGMSLNTNGTGVGSALAKWTISNGVCQPTNHGNECNDVTIFKAWVAAHDDALFLLSGGERAGGYSLEDTQYSTDYMTQFILPKNLTEPQWLTDYCTHLEDDRGEDEPDVENTAGATCGDYAFDNYDIPTFFINLNVSQMWADRNQYAQSQDSADKYMYRNYETGRRIANIVNFILMAGGDINND